MAIRQQTELANTNEPMRQNMLGVAPQELRCRERHETLLVSTRVVFPAESDVFSIEEHQAMITDSNAMFAKQTPTGRPETMCVPAQIPEHRGRPRHRVFYIGDPALTMQRPKKGGECLRLAERSGGTAEAELAAAIRAFESVHKLALKNFLQHAHRQEEVITRMNPATVISGETAGRDKTMKMRM